jgi:hypothetical protein
MLYSYSAGKWANRDKKAIDYRIRQLLSTIATTTKIAKTKIDPDPISFRVFCNIELVQSPDRVRD